MGLNQDTASEKPQVEKLEGPDAIAVDLRKLRMLRIEHFHVVLVFVDHDPGKDGRMLRLVEEEHREIGVLRTYVDVALASGDVGALQGLQDAKEDVLDRIPLVLVEGV